MNLNKYLEEIFVLATLLKVKEETLGFFLMVSSFLQAHLFK